MGGISLTGGIENGKSLDPMIGFVTDEERTLTVEGDDEGIVQLVGSSASSAGATGNAFSTACLRRPTKNSVVACISDVHVSVGVRHHRLGIVQLAEGTARRSASCHGDGSTSIEWPLLNPMVRHIGNEKILIVVHINSLRTVESHVAETGQTRAVGEDGRCAIARVRRKA